MSPRTTSLCSFLFSGALGSCFLCEVFTFKNSSAYMYALGGGSGVASFIIIDEQLQ